MGNAARAQRRPAVDPSAGICARCKQRPSTTSCTWKLHKKDSEGRRVLAGGTCDVKMCETCAFRAGEGVLCRWHETKAREEGLVK